MQEEYLRIKRIKMLTLTFNGENTGASRCASVVDGFTHIFPFIFWEGLWQVEAIGFSSFNILIVLRVLQHFPLKPPCYFRFWFSSNFNCKSHWLAINNWCVFQWLLKPGSSRSSLILLIFTSRTINNASLFFFFLFPFLFKIIRFRTFKVAIAAWLLVIRIWLQRSCHVSEKGKCHTYPH